MRRKKRRILAGVMAAVMTLSGGVSAFAEQNDDYTKANLENDGGVGGTVYGENGTTKNSDGSAITFNEHTDYDDDTFKQSDDVNLESTTYADDYDKDNMDPMTGDELEETIDALMASMTYDEKIHMVSMNTDPEDRDGVGYMTGIPRLGVPESRMHDGPSGISTSGDSYVETTNFPLQLVASQTWSTNDLYAYGEALGKEHKSTGSGWQLGTQLDLCRSPQWARVKDSLGEDWILASDLGTSLVEGVQENGGIAMAKHIGAYSTDGDTSLWVRVDDQTLHEAYLQTFETAAKEGCLASIMGTYNRLNGYYVSSNEYLQKHILRDEWNWDGAMVPDWGADRESLSMLLGTSISQSNADSIDKAFRSACYQKLATMDTLDDAVRQALYAYGVCGFLNGVQLDGKGYVKQDTSRAKEDQYGQMSSDYDDIANSRIRYTRTYTEDVADGLLDESNETALKLAEDGITLLKNEDDTLPLTKEDYSGDDKVALIGYGATNLIGGTGGERSFGVLRYMTTPLESMKELAGDNADNISGYVLDDVHGVTIPDVYTDEAMTESGWTMTDKMVEGDVKQSGGGQWGPPPQAQSVPEDTNITTDSDDSKDAAAETTSEAENTAVTEDSETQETASTESASEDALVTASEDSSEDADVTSTVVDDVHLYCTANGRSFQNDETGNALEDGEEAEWIGYIKAPATGEYKFVIQTNGGTAKVQVTGLNDDVSGDASAEDGVSWDYYTTEGLNYKSCTVNLTEGNEYKILVDAQQTSAYRDQGVKLGWITPTENEENMDAALEAASTPDTTVVMFTRTGATGHGPVFQTDFDISLDEVDEIKEVQAAAKAAGNKFVLVTFGRSAYSFEGDWLDDTDALICPYYAGQAAGTALAEIIMGEVNPSGHLTVSMPKTNADTVLTYGYYDNDETSTNYNTERAGDQSTNSYTANYTEGLNFGYRFYDTEDLDGCQYPFGYGLSYTDFEFSNMKIKKNAKDGESIGYDVTVDVKNTGSVKGSTVAQVYLGQADVPDGVQSPVLQLGGYARVEDIKPGETVKATIHVGERALSYWYSDGEYTVREDGSKDKYVVAEGQREFSIGDNADNMIETKTVNVKVGSTGGGSSSGGSSSADNSGESKNVFTDVSSDAYYYTPVYWALDKGVTAGTTATTFSPNDATTRAQMVQFLYNLAGKPAVSGDMPFTDVSSTAYYHDAVLWAVQNGVTAGTTATTFSPNESCTRAQMVQFLYNLEKKPAVSGTMTFTDVPADAYYYDAVLWASEKGVTAGKTATTFAPKDICTRAQMVQFLYNYSK